MNKDNEVKTNMAKGGGVILGALLGTVAVKVAEATFDHFFYKKERAEAARRAGERLASVRLMSSMAMLRIQTLTLLHEGKTPADALAHIGMLREASARVQDELREKEGLTEAEETYFKEKVAEIKRLSDELDQTLKSLHAVPPQSQPTTVVEAEVITHVTKEETHVERTSETTTAPKDPASGREEELA